MDKQLIKTVIKAGLGVAAGIIVATLDPPAGMTAQGMQGLGIVVWAIIWWIFSVLPEYITALLMSVFFALFGLVTFREAFATFSDTTMWLLMSALGLGVALSQSGLLRRVALSIMRRFPLNFSGQVLGLLGVGLVTAPFIPSTNAKVAMLAPLTRAINDAMGYERKSMPAAGLFGAMFTGVCNMGPIFISASVMGFLVQGFLPPEVRSQFNIPYWLLCALPWGIVMSILNYLAIVWIYRPKTESNITSSFITEQLDQLGPMKGQERFTAVVILFTFLLWVTEPLHGLAPVIVSILGLCVIAGSGILTREDFRSEIPWDSLIFIGATINLSIVFNILKINDWLVSIFSPFIAHFSGNIYLLILVLALVTYAVRIVIVSQMAYISIFMVFLVPLAVQAGINPWIVGFTIYATVNSWILFYQNPVYLTAYYAAHGDFIEHSHTIPLGLVYMVIAILGLFACVPLWQWLGMIG